MLFAILERFCWSVMISYDLTRPLNNIFPVQPDGLLIKQLSPKNNTRVLGPLTSPEFSPFNHINSILYIFPLHYDMLIARLIF